MRSQCSNFIEKKHFKLTDFHVDTSEATESDSEFNCTSFETDDANVTRQINLREIIVKSKGLETAKYRLVEKRTARKQTKGNRQAMNLGLLH